MSVAAAQKIAIKAAVGKSALARKPDAFYDYCEKQGFWILPIPARYALAAYELPLLHRGPFDRMLIGQAQTEQLILMTGDPLIEPYEVQTLW